MLPFHFRVLTISGVWCPTHWSSVQRVLYKCYSFIVIVLMYSLAFSQIAHILLVKQNFNTFNDTFFILLSTNFACFKAVSNLINQKHIIYLANMFNQKYCLVQDEFERVIQKQYDDFCRRIVIILLTIVEISALFVVVAPLCGPMNNQDLPYQVLLPYDLSNKFFYWLTFVHHSLGAVLFTTISITNDAVITGYMMQICGQLDILQHRLVLLPGTLAKSSTKDRITGYNTVAQKHYLKRIVSHHIHIFCIAKKICSTFNDIVICQFCISALEVCVTVYQLSIRNNSTVELLTYAIYLIVMLGQFFVYCYFGNEVTIQSKIVGSAIFHLDWTSFSIDLKKDLIVIMLYISKPIAMSCGPFVHLTLQSFTNILKTSYSAFSVLKRTVHDTSSFPY